MGFDLGKIQDPGAGSKKSSGKVSGFDLEKVTNTAPLPSGFLPGILSGGNFNEFRFQPKVGADNFLLRAQDQAWWEQGSKMVGNAVSNIVTGLVEGFGYIPELWDKEKDFSNALTRQMQEWHNPFGGIYREHPDQTFDLSDPAWWFTNVQQLVESAGAFALEGAALGKIFGTLARGAGEIVSAGKLGVQGMKAANTTAQVLSGSVLAYTEGAMSGYHIYNDAYRLNYNKGLQGGMNPDQADASAKQIAGNAAATTVRLNTIMNTMLNVGILAPLFKEPKDEVLHWFRNQGTRQKGESLDVWKNRIQQASMEIPELREAVMARYGLTSRSAEAIKEGIEEVNTQYAEAEGERVAAGDNRSLGSALIDIGQYFEDVTDQEGALNLVLGMFGGGVQTAIIDHLPSRQIIKVDPTNNEPIIKKTPDGKILYGKDGQPKYETALVSSRSYTEFGSKRYFSNIKDSIIADIDFHQRKYTDLLVAKAKGNEAEAEKIRNEIFSVGALNAVSKGLTDSWMEMYREIAAFDNTKYLGATFQPVIDSMNQQWADAMEKEQYDDTDEIKYRLFKVKEEQAKVAYVTEAMKRGFANSPNDDNYKIRALKAVGDLEYLRDLHRAISKQYVDMRPVTGDLADHLFFRKADLYLRKQAIDREESRIASLEELMLRSELPVGDLFEHEIKNFSDHAAVQNETIKRLLSDVENLEIAQKKGDIPFVKSLIEKYRAKGAGEKDVTTAVTDLIKAIHLKVKQLQLSISESRKRFEESLGYEKWKTENPDQDFEKFLSQIGDNLLLGNDRANLEEVKVQHSLAKQTLEKLINDNGITQLVKALAEDKKELIKSINERNRKANVDNFLLQQSRESVARLDLHQKNILAERTQKAIDQIYNQLNEATERKTYFESELKAITGIFSDINSSIKLKDQLNYWSDRITKLNKQLEILRRQQTQLTSQVMVAVVKEQEVVVETHADLAKIPTENSEEFTIAPDPTIFDPVNDTQLSSFTHQELMGESIEISSSDAIDAYINLKNELPGAALLVLDKLEGQFNNRALSFQATHDAFRELLNLEIVSRQQVNEAYLSLSDFLAAKKVLNSKPTTESKIDLQDDLPKDQQQAPVITTDDIPGEQDNGQPEIFINAALFTEEALESAYWEQSAKTTNAVKVNAADLKYIPVRVGDRIMLRNETINGGPMLDDTTNKERMVPGIIGVGDDVRLEIDADWAGIILNDHVITQDENLRQEGLADSFTNYLDRDGKIRVGDHEAGIGYGNVPIKIVHVKTGRVVGYFPRVDWITATQGAGNYRNVEDLQDADESGERSPGNVQLQAQMNLRIRQRIARMWNENRQSSLITKVAERTPGRIMYAGDLTESTGRVKYKLQLVSKLLPDEKLQFVIGTKGGLMIGKGIPAGVTLPLTRITPDQQNNLIGAPIVMIPLPNGTFFPAPLQTTQFQDRLADINTVLTSIELYLQNDTEFMTEKGQKLISQILSKTGFDITTEEGLNDFIQQYYTFTSNFEDTLVKADARVVEGGAKVQRFMIAIPKKAAAAKKSTIKVGVSYSGHNVVYAQLIEGRLDPRFAEELRLGLNERFKNVTFTHGNLLGINDPRPITEVRINRDGQLWSKSYKSYNEYLKSFTYTSIYGLHNVGNTYVYAANSQIILDEEALLPTIPTQNNIRELPARPDIPPGEIQEVKQDDAADIISDMENFNRAYPGYVRHVIQPEGQELTLTNLEDLLKDTEISQRNEKTPDEVFSYLHKLGITRIAYGYNPFLKCL